jgi:hypothetical protein
MLAVCIRTRPRSRVRVHRRFQNRRKDRCQWVGHQGFRSVLLMQQIDCCDSLRQRRQQVGLCGSGNGQNETSRLDPENNAATSSGACVMPTGAPTRMQGVKDALSEDVERCRGENSRRHLFEQECECSGRAGLILLRYSTAHARGWEGRVSQGNPRALISVAD